LYRGADKSLARPGRKQARKHVSNARSFNNIETLAVIKVFSSARQGAEGNSAILTKTLACFLRSRAKNLSAPLYGRNWLLCTVRTKHTALHTQALPTDSTVMIQQHSPPFEQLDSSSDLSSSNSGSLHANITQVF